MTCRIALIIPTMDRGGAEKQLCLLASQLPRDQFDVHVLVLTHDGPRSAAVRDAGIPVTVIGKRFKLDPSALVRLQRVLKRLQPDLVHTWLFAANSFGRVAARWAGVPRIIASERSVDPWKTALQHAIDRRLARWTDRITTNSTGVRDFYAAQGIDPQLFTVIPNGIGPRVAATISRHEALARLGLPAEQRLILSVGRLWPQKRYRDLIWAGELVATVREDTSYVIIGDGPQRGELLRHRDAISHRDHVRFVGDRADVAELLPHAAVFWIGSEYEGQSNALLEAMQVGLPVVASDIPGNRDLVTDGETGRLVAVGDAADFARQSIALLDDVETAERFGAAAQDRIATAFTVEAMVAGHAELYQRLAGGESQIPRR